MQRQVESSAHQSLPEHNTIYGKNTPPGVKKNVNFA